MTSHRSTLSPQPRVQLHIEEVVLHGFKPANHHRIQDAVEIELARLLATRALAPRSLNVSVLDGGEFISTPGDTADGTAEQIARSVHRVLTDDL